MKKFFLCLAMIAAMAAPVSLLATPITGQMSIYGTVQNTGTELDFLPGSIHVGQGTQTETFALLLTDNQAITSGPTSVSYSPYTPNSAVFGIDPLTITLESLVAQTFTLNGSSFTVFSGNALFSANGYDDTMGSFSFSTQDSGWVTFSATGSTPAVPEPSSILLFGTGALALACLGAKRVMA